MKLRRLRRRARLHTGGLDGPRQPESEVVVRWIERIGLEFKKNSAEALLDSIDAMKEVPLFNTQIAAAKLPVRSQHVVIAEKPVVPIIEIAARDPLEVSDILLLFPRPSAAVAFSDRSLLVRNLGIKKGASASG